MENQAKSEHIFSSCPFCGSDDISFDLGTPAKEVSIICNGCKTLSPTVEISGDCYEKGIAYAAARAIKAWNTRAPAHHDAASQRGISLDSMGLTIRTVSCLKNASIFSTDDLKGWSYQELLKLPNLGRSSLEELKKQLDSIGISI